MANIKLFNIKNEVKEYEGGTVTLEKELQTVIEKNMETFFGVTFLASEYRTTDGGRMDSIGIDENNCPVIFEYKRSIKDNVINQGLFYLNWLLDHKDSFKILVINNNNNIGAERAELIDWSMPRVICIAGDFTKYDESAIKQMNRNISLIRYKKFGSDLLMFEQVNESVVEAIQEENNTTPHTKTNSNLRLFSERLKTASPTVLSILEDLKNYVLSLGDDVSLNQLRYCLAFKKIKNIISVGILKDTMTLYLKIDPNTINYEKGFTRDTSKIGYFGTGNVEVKIHTREDYEKAKPLIDRAYNEN